MSTPVERCDTATPRPIEFRRRTLAASMCSVVSVICHRSVECSVYDDRAELEPDLADRLAESLQVAGLSVGDMAEYIEVHRIASTGGDRRTQPRPANIRLWAIRCGIPYEWLRYGTSPDESEQVNGT